MKIVLLPLLCSDTKSLHLTSCVLASYNLRVQLSSWHLLLTFNLQGIFFVSVMDIIIISKMMEHVPSGLPTPIRVKKSKMMEHVPSGLPTPIRVKKSMCSRVFEVLDILMKNVLVF